MRKKRKWIPDSNKYPTLLITCVDVETANLLCNQSRFSSVNVEHYLADTMVRQKMRIADLAADVLYMFGHDQVATYYVPLASEKVQLQSGSTWHGLKYASGEFRFHEIGNQEPSEDKYGKDEIDV